MAGGGEKAAEALPGDALSRAIGARVAELRTERGIATQKDLAARAGMSPAYVWRIEAGQVDVSVRNLARLCQALDVDLSGLFHGIDVADLDLGKRDYTSSPGVGRPRKARVPTAGGTSD